MANGFLTGFGNLNQGSNIMTLDGGVDASHVASGSRIELDGFLSVEGISGKVGEITLRRPWAKPDQTGVEFVITYTIEGLVDAIEKSRVLSEQWQQAVTEVDTVISGAATAVQDLEALQTDIAAAATDLSAIQGVLDADKQASANSAGESLMHSETSLAHAETSLTHAGASEGFRNQSESFALAAAASFDNFDDKYLGSKTADPTVDNDGDPLTVGQVYWHDSTDVNQRGLRYFTGVVWEKPDAVAAASAANAQADAILAYQYANHPEDTFIPGTGYYSAYHWKQKTQSLSSGTAPDSLLFNGEAPAYYATQAELDSHSHTLVELGLDTLESDLTQSIGTVAQGLSDLQDAFNLLKLELEEQAEVNRMLALTVGGNPKASTIHATDVQLSSAVDALQAQITALQANHV